MLTAHVRNAEGEWITKEVQGVAFIEDWSVAREVAMVGIVMECGGTGRGGRRQTHVHEDG